MTAEPLDRWAHHDDYCPAIGAKGSCNCGLAEALDAARKASPLLDVERLTEATEAVLGRGEVSTNDGSMGTDHAARLIAAAYDALDPTP